MTSEFLIKLCFLIFPSNKPDICNFLLEISIWPLLIASLTKYKSNMMKRMGKNYLIIKNREGKQGKITIKTNLIYNFPYEK